MTKNSSLQKRGIDRRDIAAFVLIACVAALYFIVASNSVSFDDEGLYYSIPHRFILGDRMISDEWYVVQFTSLFQYIPFRIFYAVTGSTEGVILFFRFVHVVFKIAFGAALYLLLRRYRAWSLPILLYALAYDPMLFRTLSYYDLASAFMTISLCLLFIRQKRDAFGYIAAGFAFGCAVVNSPAWFLLWFVYAGAVLLCLILKKRYALCDKKGFLQFTAGGAACALLALIFVFRNQKPSDVFINLKEFFSDSEHFFGLSLVAHKLSELMLGLGPGVIGLVLFAVTAVLIAVFRKKLFDKDHGIVKSRLYHVLVILVFVAFIILDVSMIGMGCISKSIYWASGHYKPFAVSVLGIFVWILSAKKDRRLFAYYVAAMAASLIYDLTSNTSTFSSAVTAIVPVVLMTRDLVSGLREPAVNGEPEQPEEGRRGGRSPAGRALVCVTVAAALFICGELVYASGAATWRAEDLYYDDSEYPLSVELAAGPMKGLKTNAPIADKYADMTADLDAAKQLGDTLYVAEFAPWYYIYAGMDYGCYSTAYVEGDFATRQLRYWQLHGDKIPDVIYVPYVRWSDYGDDYDPDRADKRCGEIESFFECERISGKAGVLLKVLSSKF